MARRRDKQVPFRKPFKAVPLRVVRNPPPRKAGGEGWFKWLLVALPLAVFTAVFLFGVPDTTALDFAAAASPAPDRESARFALCGSARRVTCVVDGDTIWYRGAKIRVADINAPEVSEPHCPREAALGARATSRLLVLLNQGPFTLAPNNDGSGRDRDRYGRELRVLTRNGASLGGVLVDEGLAEQWRGYKRNWC